jgi:hypothetical protein
MTMGKKKRARNISDADMEKIAAILDGWSAP